MDATRTSPFSSPTDAAPDGPPSPVPLMVSDEALGQVLNILSAEENADELALRVEVTGVNGAEYAYELSFDERTTARPEDLLYGQGELSVIIPEDSIELLWGATLDLPSTAGQAGLVIRNPNRPDPLGASGVQLEGTVRERIEQLLAQVINPGLASHGGFATLMDVDEEAGRAVVTMGGGCHGCAVSAITLREGIQRAIVDHIPEIREVVDATDHETGENPYYS